MARPCLRRLGRHLCSSRPCRNPPVLPRGDCTALGGWSRAAVPQLSRVATSSPGGPGLLVRAAVAVNSAACPIPASSSPPRNCSMPRRPSRRGSTVISAGYRPAVRVDSGGFLRGRPPYRRPGGEGPTYRRTGRTPFESRKVRTLTGCRSAIAPTETINPDSSRRRRENPPRHGSGGCVNWTGLGV